MSTWCQQYGTTKKLFFGQPWIPAPTRKEATDLGDYHGAFALQPPPLYFLTTG